MPESFNGDIHVLVTGAAGFIGPRVVESLLRHGYRRVSCFVRPSSNRARLDDVISRFPDAEIRIVEGNLLSAADCTNAVEGVAVIYHLAAGRDKSFAGAFANSVLTTRNLLEAARPAGILLRFVNVSSLAVYSNHRLRRGTVLDERCPLEGDPWVRHEPYAFGKLKQEQFVVKYGNEHNVPYVIVRPGNVFGPGKSELPSRIGIDTFGRFLHLGGGNRIPYTYVDNCADAIVLAGVTRGIEGEALNIVDDDLPRSRSFLRAFKRSVAPLRTLRVPYRLFYGFCWFWEHYASRSQGQLPAAFNRARCETYWKGNKYSNVKIKALTGWEPSVPHSEAAEKYFEYARNGGGAP